MWLICASADATSGDIADPPSILPTGGTVVVAIVWWVLALLVLSSSCVVLKIAYGLGLAYPMLSQCWVHADGVEVASECFVEEVFHGSPCLKW